MTNRTVGESIAVDLQLGAGHYSQYDDHWNCCCIIDTAKEEVAWYTEALTANSKTFDSPVALTSCEHALKEGAGILIIHEVMQGANVVIGQQSVSQGVKQVRVDGVMGGCWLSWKQTHLASQCAPLGLLHAQQVEYLMSLTDTHMDATHAGTAC